MNITLKENETMKDLVERLTESFEMVYDVAPVAYWYENLYENGRVKDIHFSPRMREMLGYKTIEEFPDELNTLMTFTHPDDVHIMLDDAIRAGTGEIDKYDVQYRIRKADGSYMWCNATGELVKDCTGTTVGMYGAFIDVSQEVELNEEQETERKIREVINGFSKEYDAAFYGNMAEKTYKKLANVEAVEKKVETITSIEDAMKSYVEFFVHPDDAALFEGEYLDTSVAMKNIPVGESKTFEYRSKSGGDYAWYKAMLRRITDDEILVGFKNCDDEIVTRRISEMVIGDFASVLLVNIKNDSYRFISSNYGSGVPDFFNGKYTETTEKYISGVDPDYREYWNIMLDLGKLQKMLAERGRLEFVYPLTNAEKRWRRCVVERFETENGVPVSFIMTFFVLDDASAENLELTGQLVEQKARLEESLTFTNYFLNTYVTAYYINLNTRDYKVYKGPITQLGKSQLGGHDYLEALTAFFKMVVNPEDLDELIAIIQPETLKEQLNKGDVSYNFRDERDGDEKIIRMQIIRGADENHAAFGFRDVTEEYREQQKHLLGAVPISPDILAKENIGMWAFELDEGQPPRMYGDEAMIKLVGLDHQVPPEEMYHAWYDQIDDESYGLVNDAVEKMMSGEHAEVQYPWHHPDGHTMIVRCGGVRNPEYTKGIRVEGTHQNVTEVLHFDEEQIQQRRRMNMIYSLSDEFDPIFVLDPETGEYDWYESKAEEIEELTAMSVHGDDFYKDIGVDTVQIIHDEDKERFRAVYNKENMMRIAETGAAQETENRWKVGPGGTYLWKYNKIVRMTDEDGKVYVVVGVIDTTEAKEKEALQITNAVLSEYLLNSYATAYYTNIKTGEINLLHSIDGRKQLKDDGIPVSHDSLVDTYVDGLVDPDDAENFRINMDRENIRKRLESTDSFSFTFRDNSESEPTVYRCTIMRGADADHVATGFQDITEEVRQQEEQQRQLENALDIANEANKNTELVLSFVNGIKWSYFINDNDEIFAAKYGENEAESYDVGHRGDPMDWVKLLHPEDKDFVVKEFMNAILDRSGKGTVNMTYRLLDTDGKYHWTRVSGKVNLHEDGVRELFGISIDVTDQMEKEREQQRKLEEQLALSDGLAREYHTVWLVDGFGEHRLHLFRSTGRKTVQRAVQRGLDEPTYDGTMVKYVMDSVHEDDRERVLEMSKFETVERETPEVGTYVVSYKRYCDDEGNVDYHQMCFARAVAEDGTVNYILAFRDADKMLREQIAQQKQLAEALSMAESANRAKTTFLNSMSHDIRTPMNAIIGFTGLAASHIDNKEQVQNYLSKIGQSSNHLLSLINDVLDMSRIESGKMNLDEKPENLPDIIHTLRDIVQSEIHAKQHDFFIDTVNVKDENIIVDKLRLNQVLLNILSNAIKYTAQGGTVSMRITELTVKPSGYATYEFRIKDNGMGMSKEFLDTLFDPFTRAKSSTVSGIQGTGLGMAVTKNIVDMMGGKIEVNSEPNKGTEMIVTFDFKLADEPKKIVEIPELSGLRGLVVDDDANACLSIYGMLKEVGMRSEWCTSGKEAIFRAEAAYREGDLFKVYIIDWLMPDMNGIETTRRIRKVIGDDVPIIILTAYDWSEIEDEAREAGVTAFVSKPMFPSDLHRVLYDCLGKEEEIDEKPVKEYDFTGHKILLVEDNELNREIATEILEEEGFIIDAVEDGDIAVEKMRAAKTGDYDLVLMDIQMPRMNGYEATRQIRALGTDISRIPILAMTANAFEEDKRLALEAGMNEHITKPIDVEALKETLAKYL